MRQKLSNPDARMLARMERQWFGSAHFEHVAPRPSDTSFDANALDGTDCTELRPQSHTNELASSASPTGNNVGTAQSETDADITQSPTSVDGLPRADASSYTAKQWVSWGFEQFRPGYRLDLFGAHDSADRHYQSVIDKLEDLRTTNSEITDDVVGTIALRHGIRLYTLGKFLGAEAALLTAFRSFEQGLTSDSSIGRIRDLARAASWLGRTRRGAEDHRAALRAYEHGIALWRSALRFEGDATLRLRETRSLAAVLTGAARSLAALGERGRSADYSAQARTLLDRIASDHYLN